MKMTEALVHPVRKYLDTLTWDQEPRIESCLIKLVETKGWLNATPEKTA